MNISTTSLPNPVLPKVQKSTGSLPTHKAYLVGLDSLRGLAALMVCLYHFTNGALPKVIMPTTKWLFSHGNLGVEIFFVISGFIIPYSLIGKNYRAHGFFVYIKKRLIRINPPAYAAILLTVGQAFFIDKVIQHSTKYTSSISWMQVLNNFLFTVPFTQYKWLVGVLWTLAIEFQFYLLIGLLFPLLFERQRVWWFVGLYLLLAVGQVVAATSDSFLQYSSLFALGGIALLWQQQRLATWQYGSLLALFTGVIYYQLGIYVAGAGICTAIILNLLTVQVPGLRLLGKISYSFYLLHILIGTSCEFFLIKIIPPASDGAKLLIVALSIVAALIGSYLFYRIVEMPFMRIASRQR